MKKGRSLGLIVNTEQSILIVLCKFNSKVSKDLLV